MNVPFQVRVPVGVALAIKTRLQDLEGSQGKVAGRTGRQAVLSVSNFLRLAVNLGVDHLLREDTETLRAKLADEGVTRGRPRRVA